MLVFAKTFYMEILILRGNSHVIITNIGYEYTVPTQLLYFACFVPLKSVKGPLNVWSVSAKSLATLRPRILRMTPCLHSQQ